MAGRKTKLDKTVRGKIVKALKAGVTVADACQYAGVAEATYYNWIERGKAAEPEFLEFLEAVTRAKVDAKVTAITTLRAAMSPTVSRTKKTHRVTETKENVYGKPYEYKLVDEVETETAIPGDWRAALEYLKRRAPDEWSEKYILELNLPTELLKRFVDATKAAGISAGDALEAFVQELANTQLAADRTDGSA